VGKIEQAVKEILSYDTSVFNAPFTVILGYEKGFVSSVDRVKTDLVC